MFLLLHYHQLKRQVSPVGKRDLISDFHLGKDLLYARLNFEDLATIQFRKALRSS